MLKGRWREAGREGMWEGGQTTESSSAVINLGSDTGLRGLASTAPHNWVTHRGRPTQAIMWWSVGGGLGEMGEGGSHTDISSFALKPRGNRSHWGEWLRFRQWKREPLYQTVVFTRSLWHRHHGEECLHAEVSVATSTWQHPQVEDSAHFFVSLMDKGSRNGLCRRFTRSHCDPSLTISWSDLSPPNQCSLLQ